MDYSENERLLAQTMGMRPSDMYEALALAEMHNAAHVVNYCMNLILRTGCSQQTKDRFKYIFEFFLQDMVAAAVGMSQENKQHGESL